MTSVDVIYRCHDQYWYAVCTQVPELAAGDPSLEVLRTMVSAALRDFTGNEFLEIREVVEESAGIG